MDYFQSVEIEENEQQITVIVHVDYQTAREQWVGTEDPMTEFAAEFMQLAGDKLAGIQQRVADYLQQQNWSGHAKRAMVVVMLGSVVLTSFPLPTEAFAATSTPIATATASTVVNNTTIPHLVQAGDSLWKIATRYRVTIDAIKQQNALNNDTIYPSQLLQIPLPMSATLAPIIVRNTYTVVAGDTLWSISVKAGIPMSELLKENGLTMDSVLKPGQTLQVPVHYIPIRPVASVGAGEYLDWWTEAQYVLPIGKTATVTDVKTGQSWQVKRTIGAFHSDTEPVSAADAAIMKKVWGGTYSWATRAVLVKVDGRIIAASASSMPHGVEYVANNDFNGHFDLHFRNSTRHKDGLVDPYHQAQIRIAAGVTGL
jgi:LysM repeat protein